ncbi:protein neprosin-like isoform X2 [Cicer arietinum]|uniref:Uncharacterized protein LOC101511248 isoform X2 n=1 Tax=Cicer arietinum TaxID=3827 RepID=A0A3Q7Y1J0_CICAR|nr:uncharacterized protein LOC101511248 isoform X2 [Cicer arietinum]
MALFLFLVIILFVACCNIGASSKTLLDEQYNSTVSDSIVHQVDNDFECVDIHKQPTLQHPLLKNHKIQLYPTFAKNIVRNRSYSKIVNECPTGKVPIYNRTRRHQIVNNSSSNLQIEDFQYYSQSSPGYHTVTLDTTQNVTFHGAYAFIGVYNLSLQQNQYSASSIWVESGPQTQRNSIRVGVEVHPSLYEDSRLRITGYWTVDGQKNNGCYNYDCSGFVQVNQMKNCTLGAPIRIKTGIGSTKKEFMGFRIQQDRSTGNWWLSLVPKPVFIIGYWPKELFTHLSTGASLIRFGGQTYAPPNMDSPPMGSGRLPKEKFKNSGFMGSLQIIDSDYNQNDVKPKDMKRYSDTDSNCYDLWYHGDEGPFWRQAFLYGGPGGKCNI